MLSLMKVVVYRTQHDGLISQPIISIGLAVPSSPLELLLLNHPIICVLFLLAVMLQEESAQLCSTKLKTGSQRNKLANWWWRATVASCVPGQCYFPRYAPSSHIFNTSGTLIRQISLTTGNWNDVLDPVNAHGCCPFHSIPPFSTTLENVFGWQGNSGS